MLVIDPAAGLSHPSAFASHISTIFTIYPNR